MLDARFVVGLVDVVDVVVCLALRFKALEWNL